MVSYRFLRVFVVSYQELRTRKTLPYAILPSMWSIVGEKGPAPWDARVPLGVADDRPLSLPVLLPPFPGHPRADQLQPRPGTQTGSGAVPDLFPRSEERRVGKECSSERWRE